MIIMRNYWRDMMLHTRVKNLVFRALALPTADIINMNEKRSQTKTSDRFSHVQSLKNPLKIRQ